MKGEILSNNGTLQSVERNAERNIPAAIPLPWREYYNSYFKMSTTYGENERHAYLGVIHSDGGYHPSALIGTGGELDIIATASGKNIMLKKGIEDILPMNQNRIQVFMDIYDAYQRARDAYVKTVDYDIPAQIKEFKESIQNAQKVQDNGLYKVLYKGKNDKTAYFQEPPPYNTASVGLSDSEMYSLNEVLTERQKMFYEAIRQIADALAAELPEGKEANIQDNNRGFDSVAYRLGRLYQTLYYFDNDWDGEIDPELTSVYALNACNKLERLRADGRFLSNPIDEKSTKTYPKQISQFADLASELVNKHPSVLPKGVKGLQEKIKKERDERLKRDDNLCYQRDKRSNLKNDIYFPSTFSVFNFNPNTCLFRNITENDLNKSALKSEKGTTK